MRRVRFALIAATSLAAVRAQFLSNATWQPMPQAPWGGRTTLGATNDGAYVYVVGGANATAAYADVWSTSDGLVWTQMTGAAPFGPRVGHAVTSFGTSKLMLAGGRTRDALGTLNKLKNDVWQSQDGGTTWLPLTESAPWSARYGHVLQLFGGEWLLMGGLTPIPQNDVWVSANGTSWSTYIESHAPWSPRAFAAVAVFDGDLYIAGGTDLNQVFNDVWSTANGKVWTPRHAEGSPRWPSRAGFNMLVFSYRLWIIGGTSNDTDPGIWSAAGLGDAWKQVAPSTPWGVRNNMGVALLGSSFLAFGGAAVVPPPVSHGIPTYQFMNDVWKSRDPLYCEVNGLVCSAHGQCGLNGTVYACVCDDGWISSTCNETACGPHNCKHGVCVASNDSARGVGASEHCECFPGWTGDSCAAPQCREGCENGGCVLPGQCTCLQGWRGPVCSIRETLFEDIGQWVRLHADSVFVTTVSLTGATALVAALLINYLYRGPGVLPAAWVGAVTRERGASARGTSSGRRAARAAREAREAQPLLGRGENGRGGATSRGRRVEGVVGMTAGASTTTKATAGAASTAPAGRASFAPSRPNFTPSASRFRSLMSAADGDDEEDAAFGRGAASYF